MFVILASVDVTFSIRQR